LPGLVVLSIMGHQIVRILTHPNPADLALLVGAVAAWILVSVGLQMLVSKRWSERP